MNTQMRTENKLNKNINPETAAKLEARIAAAEIILAPYRADMQREWSEMERREWKEASCGIADKLCRAYCYAVTGFANYRTRAESHGWYWLAREAREALHIADDSDDARRWCASKVAAIEFAADLAKEVA